MSCRRHGHAAKGHVTPEYRAWTQMKIRCYNPTSESFKDYGGRGIKVCARWLNSFKAFLADLGPRPSPELSLDRIQNDKDYEPGNVRWATRAVQSVNRRSSRTVHFHGNLRLVLDLASEFHISTQCVLQRLDRGWGIERALTTPPRVTERKRQ